MSERRYLLSCLVACAILMSSMAAGAANLAIEAFAGKWQGSAVSESDISVHFRLTSRDIDVEVRPQSDGFAITWNTVQRQTGNPSNPVERLKSTSLSFRAAGPNLWASRDNADPLTSGAPYVWATVKERTLVISSLRIYADGRHELQIYRRTLSGTGMTLDFERLVDGENVRRASGRLVKVAR